MAKRKTTAEFIQAAIVVHGDKYDYSKTEYINDGSKDGTTLTIICPVHGKFEQRGSVHLRGAGCNKCGHGETAKKRRKTQEDFIKESKNKHGEKYDYGKAEYKGDKDKVEIICPEHGSFWQSAGGHLSGKGCTPCYRKRQHLLRKDELSDFIEKARSVHGDNYDYSKADYKLSGVKVEIICPEHGSFWQTPNAHISRKSQCPKCAHESGKLKLRLSLSDFIEKAKSVHGDKYDYSKAEYINSHTKTLIICQIHGEFWQIPNSHLSGLGCDKCGGTCTISTEDAIQRSRAKHGNKYDYSKVSFKTSLDKVEIICPDHGSFYQQISLHYRGSGCPKCSGRNKTTEEFIEKAKKIHGNKYDYSETQYMGATKKLKVICPNHGEFWQVPYSHLQNGNGCIKCAGTEKKTIEDFIENSRQVHGDKYDYSKSQYTGSSNNITIGCPKHGDFSQVAYHHQSGIGCPLCGIERLSDLFSDDKESFVQKAISVHGDKYDYGQVEYQNSWTKVIIECSNHGFFKQRPSSHLRGSGCPKCGEYGFNPRLPSIIYFLKLQTSIATFWKIGITNRSVKKRFGRDYESIKLGWTWNGDGDVIWQVEQDLLRQYQEYKLNYLFPLLHNGGDTECFNLDLPVKKIIKTITQKLQNPPEIINGGQQQGDL